MNTEEDKSNISETPSNVPSGPTQIDLYQSLDDILEDLKKH